MEDKTSATPTPTISVQEPSRAEYLEWATDHHEELVEACREAGASNAFLRVISDTVPGERHNCLMSLYRHHTDEPTPETCKKVGEVYGGGFLQTLWEGDVPEAYRHADSTNTQLMQSVFDPWELE